MMKQPANQKNDVSEPTGNVDQEAPMSVTTTPDDRRAAPNACLRSALFAVISPEAEHPRLSNELIASQDGYRIFFTGLRLDQIDADIYLQCIALASKSTNNKVIISKRDFLRSIGRKQGGEQMAFLRQRLSGMVACAVRLEYGQGKKAKRFTGNLINWGEDEATQLMYIHVTPEFIKFFETDFTAIDWQGRLRLRSALSKWLHGYYSSHKKPFPVSIGTIHRLSGSKNKNLYSFRQSIKQSMKELVETGFVVPESWGITGNDLLYLKRTMARSNQMIVDGNVGIQKIKQEEGKTSTKKKGTAETLDLFGDTMPNAVMSEPEKRQATGIYPPEFEEVWNRYPGRAGDNPKKNAFSAWSARIEEGVTTEEMSAGLTLYCEYVKIMGTENTQYVLQAATFFGPARRFAEAWKKPKTKDSKEGVVAAHKDVEDRKWSPGGLL